MACHAEGGGQFDVACSGRRKARVQPFASRLGKRELEMESRLAGLSEIQRRVAEDRFISQAQENWKTLDNTDRQLVTMLLEKHNTALSEVLDGLSQVRQQLEPYAEIPGADKKFPQTYAQNTQQLEAAAMQAAQMEAQGSMGKFHPAMRAICFSARNLPPLFRECQQPLKPGAKNLLPLKGCL